MNKLLRPYACTGSGDDKVECERSAVVCLPDQVSCRKLRIFPSNNDL